MHPMLRLLLHNTRTRRIATQLLKAMTKPNDPTARDQRELVTYLGVSPAPQETPEIALQRHLEEHCDARVDVMLDRRGVTLSPRNSERPAHRFIYPFRADAFIRNAQDLSSRERGRQSTR